MCLRILSNQDDAQDALHECYIRIWRKADQYARSRASAIAWMCAIARNASIDKLRQRRAKHDELDAAGEVADDAPSPLDAALLSSETRALMACLDELDDPKAGVIRAAFLSGRTYAELAGALNAPLGTVKSWVRRGLAQLKACLER